MRANWIAAALILAAGAPAAAQQPRVSNGQLVAARIQGSLESTVRGIASTQAAPAWIGYAVPASHAGWDCCYDGASSGCGLEPRDRQTVLRDGPPSGPVHLEGQNTIMVLYRTDEKAIERIRFFSLDCALDAGGTTIHWLDGVSPADSVRFLSSFVSHDESRGNRLANVALAAIADHADPSAIPSLIRFAHDDPSTRVRGQALFWLAQKAGAQAAHEITAAIENDPDTEVKKRAVFALSQLPKDEGVPLLIQVAKSNRNPAVRKQAMFWLGQSKDPRALAFFEEVLR